MEIRFCHSGFQQASSECWLSLQGIAAGAVSDTKHDWARPDPLALVRKSHVNISSHHKRKWLWKSDKKSQPGTGRKRHYIPDIMSRGPVEDIGLKEDWWDNGCSPADHTISECTSWDPGLCGSGHSHSIAYSCDTKDRTVKLQKHRLAFCLEQVPRCRFKIGPQVEAITQWLLSLSLWQNGWPEWLKGGEADFSLQFSRSQPITVGRAWWFKPLHPWE